LIRQPECVIRRDEYAHQRCLDQQLPERHGTEIQLPGRLSAIRQDVPALGLRSTLGMPAREAAPTL
jgi:hypothetical protein